MLLLIVAALSLTLGSRETEPERMLAVLLGEGDQFMEQVLAARWPRTVMGAAVGAALAVSGILDPLRARDRRSWERELPASGAATTCVLA